MMQHLNGKLITFEGGEGAGKTTQILLLSSRLKDAGCDPLVIREPGGTPIGETLRALIKHPPQVLFPETQLCLFLAARAQLVLEIIQPALADGRIVLCDRFTDSTIVYQGLSRGVPLSIINELNAFVTKNITPFKTFYLDLPTELSLERITNRGEPLDDLEASPSSFHEAVRYGYQSLCEAYPHRIHRLDATASPETIADSIWQTLMQSKPQPELLHA
jgi:dTMP kinase